MVSYEKLRLFAIANVLTTAERSSTALFRPTPPDRRAFCDCDGLIFVWVRCGRLFYSQLAVFVAVLLEQFEAAIAPTYPALQPVLASHTFTGWMLSVAIVVVTAVRFILPQRKSTGIPAAYLGLATVLVCLMLFQVYLGTELVWVYGLHVQPVVEAIRTGAIR